MSRICHIYGVFMPQWGPQSPKVTPRPYYAICPIIARSMPKRPELLRAPLLARIKPSGPWSPQCHILCPIWLNTAILAYFWAPSSRGAGVPFSRVERHLSPGVLQGADGPLTGSTGHFWPILPDVGPGYYRSFCPIFCRFLPAPPMEKPPRRYSGEAFGLRSASVLASTLLPSDFGVIFW